MRLLHVSAIALAAIALLAGPWVRPRAQTPDVPLPAAPQPPAANVSGSESTGVDIVDELVTAEIIASPKARILSPPRGAVRRAATAPRRSLFARVFLGSGEHKPRPFPHPAGEDAIRTR